MIASKPPEDDPVIAAALEYESATLAALTTLEESDGEAQRDACLRFADAVAVIDDMPLDDKNRGVAYLLKRGRLPAHAWRPIVAAIKILVSSVAPRPSEKKLH